MKKLSFLLVIIFLALFSLPVYAAGTNDLPLGIEIDDNVSLGNTNANISLGGYMAPFKNSKNYEESFYAYYNPPFYYLGGEPALANEENQGLIKYTWERIDNATSHTCADILSYGFDCKYINNYNDEWIFFMKNNDGCIYKVKCDGIKEIKLNLPFFVKRFLLVNDRLIIETQFSEYGKILSTNLDGDDLRLIAKCDSQCGDMMIQADGNGVYYYDDVNLELKRVSYNGKEEVLIFKGRATNGTQILTYQVCNNKIILRSYDNYNQKWLVLLDLDKSLGNPDDYEGNLYDSEGIRWYIGLPFFEYQLIPYFGDDCFNFSESGFFVYSRIMPSKFVLGLYEETFYKDNFMAYKVNLDTFDELDLKLNNEGGVHVWKDEVFYEGYIDLMGGSDYDYSLYVLNDKLYLYDPVRYLNITGLRFYSDTQISYREPNFREPPD